MFRERATPRDNVVQVLGHYVEDNRHLCTGEVELSLLTEHVPIKMHGLVVDFPRARAILLGMLRGFQQLLLHYGDSFSYETSFVGLTVRD
jgi:hypothetical protein